MLPRDLPEVKCVQIWLDSTESNEGNSGSKSGRHNLEWKGSQDGVTEIQIEDGRSQDDARSLIGIVEWLLIRCSDWTMIPLENLIAAAEGSGTRIAAAIDNPVDLRGAAFALERGVDAILLPPPVGVEDLLWKSALRLQEERLAARPSVVVSSLSRMVDATIYSIDDGGIGERVCIDLTSRLRIGEGLLIGSSSSSLCLVHGETIENEHVPTRPFRVNAGAVHAYVAMADGTTRYLCEVSAGDEVAVCDRDGVIRSAVVGRLKIERRPFLVIRFGVGEDGEQGQLFAQQAETVRLVMADGSALSVTELAIGTAIRVHVEASARHMGAAVSGSIEER